jgi:hypothetical protein
MSNPWMEEWYFEVDDEPAVLVRPHGGQWCQEATVRGAIMDARGIPVGVVAGEAPARLAAAAPALVRALLAVEWISVACSEHNEYLCGAQCGADWDRREVWNSSRRHRAGCALEAALTAAGLATQAERDAAREEIAKR